MDSVFNVKQYELGIGIIERKGEPYDLEKWYKNLKSNGPFIKTLVTINDLPEDDRNDVCLQTALFIVNFINTNYINNDKYGFYKTFYKVFAKPCILNCYDKIKSTNVNYDDGYVFTDIFNTALAMYSNSYMVQDFKQIYDSIVKAINPYFLNIFYKFDLLVGTFGTDLQEYIGKMAFYYYIRSLYDNFVSTFIRMGALPENPESVILTDFRIYHSRNATYLFRESFYTLKDITDDLVENLDNFIMRNIDKVVGQQLKTETFLTKLIDEFKLSPNSINNYGVILKTLGNTSKKLFRFIEKLDFNYDEILNGYITTLLEISNKLIDLHKKLIEKFNCADDNEKISNLYLSIALTVPELFDFEHFDIEKSYFVTNYPVSSEEIKEYIKTNLLIVRDTFATLRANKSALVRYLVTLTNVAKEVGYAELDISGDDIFNEYKEKKYSFVSSDFLIDDYSSLYTKLIELKCPFPFYELVACK